MGYSDQISIVLHGRVHPKVDLNKTIKEYIKYGKIILSVYMHDVDFLKQTVENWDDIQVVLNDINEYDEKMKTYPIHSTHFYQLQTTKKGMDLVTTPYVIKTRIDHYYSNLEVLINKCFETNKICTVSLFTRSFYAYKYHLSDNLFMGKTEEIRDVIDMSILHYPIPNQHLHPNETQLWKPYIVKKAGKLNVENDINTYVHVLTQLFEIIDLSKFKPYLYKYNKWIVNSFAEENRSTADYLLHGCNDRVVSEV
jgi:hypothetical protein